MNVLSLGGDRNAVTANTETYRRVQMMSGHVSKLETYVWPQVHSWWMVVRAALRLRPHVITTQDPFYRGLFAWKLARLTRAKLNVQVHADLGAQTWFRRLLGGFILRRAHTVRAVSDKVAAQVRETGTRAKVHTLPIYVDLDRFKRVTRVPHDRDIILWVGRFEKEKDPFEAVRILRQVRARGKDAALIMLGAGKLEKELRQAAHGLPVEFPGWKPPEDYLALADVVLSTSRAESWGASIIEALAARVPVVAPDVGIAKEAGATVVSRAELTSAIERVLEEKPEGRLNITFLDRDAWVEKWKETLA